MMVQKQIVKPVVKILIKNITTIIKNVKKNRMKIYYKENQFKIFNQQIKY